MKPDVTGLSIIFLKPGELFVTSRPSLVLTVLGSCLSVTMFNRRLGVGAICHAQLPKSGAEACCSKNCPVVCDMSTQINEAFKYVDCSICYMAKMLRSYGAAQNETEVKVFGGADVLPSRKDGKVTTIGRQNIETALRVLDTEKLIVKASSVGGTRGRKLFFYTSTGEVLQKFVKSVKC